MTTESPHSQPGEHLAEFLEECGISQYRLAKDIHVPPRRITDIVHGRRAISADTALRLGRYFGTSAPFWMNLQTAYELACVTKEIGDAITQDSAPLLAA